MVIQIKIDTGIPMGCTVHGEQRLYLFSLETIRISNRLLAIS